MPKLTRGIIWEGPSPIDGAPIVCVATDGSSNAKTGPMVQTWILRSDIAPWQAVLDGSDRSICGDCVHRRQADGTRTCYVNVPQAPTSVFKAYKAGKYPTIGLPDRGAWGSAVRIGSYGDPGALPFEAVRALASAGPRHTGYTHQWRNRPDLKAYLMASVDNDREAREARALGWRTFRVAPNRGVFNRFSVPLSAGDREIQCVSDSHNRTCADCGLCAGSQLGSAASIWIGAHGASARAVGRSLRVISVSP